MKLRKLLMTAALLVAVTASFGAKIKGSGILCSSLWDPTSCVGGVTDQNECSKDFTGPACTVLNGAHQAYYYGPGALPCTVLLRQR